MQELRPAALEGSLLVAEKHKLFLFFLFEFSKHSGLPDELT